MFLFALEAAFEFLVPCYAPRYAAFGGAAAASATGISEGSLINPAHLAFIKRGEASLTMGSWIAGSFPFYVYVGYPLEQISVCFHYMSLSYGEIEATELSETGKVVPLETSVQAADYLLALSLARSFAVWKGRLGGGVNFKFFWESLYNKTQTGFAVDFGLNYFTLVKRRKLNAGLCIRNAGGGRSPYGTSLPLPFSVCVGANVDPVFRIGFFHSFAAAVQLSYIYSAGVTLAGGLEYNYMRNFYMRAGFHLDSHGAYPSFGLQFDFSSPSSKVGFISRLSYKVYYALQVRWDLGYLHLFSGVVNFE